MPSIPANSTVWRKSSQCGGNGTCVEVARLGSAKIGARDTKRGEDGPVLQFSTSDWRTFTARIKNGDLDC
ncbi:DUF397 domain-containing protein [Actinomadura macrotermitis]|uniref:DUF397 domain-containing protein n=1 Tax=Actinomadura macrotermitis TaxID=2585200 RepID=A0A7K0C2C6_9ACTN|nr:DUF397 domain-containing protein [Actinomadura macrotermitis]MQY07568.1 hypothetical protein [Actinomadura macrotermitis]